MGFDSFEELNVWKRARELRKNIRILSNSIPKDEQFKLTDQNVRSSRSITANLAEGHGRFHFQENIQFCRTSRGSLSEVLDHLTVALDENYISEETFIQYREEIKEIERMLNGYINYLRKRKDDGK